LNFKVDGYTQLFTNTTKRLTDSLKIDSLI
jgi:hypothetical protein